MSDYGWTSEEARAKSVAALYGRPKGRLRDRKFGVHDLDRVDGPVSTQTETRCRCGSNRVLPSGNCRRCGQPRKAGT
jgi:hypothetical protein